MGRLKKLPIQLLSHREDWGIESNAESGEGYSDILIEIEEKEIGIIMVACWKKRCRVVSHPQKRRP